MPEPKIPDLGAIVRGEDDLNLALATCIIAIDMAEKAGAEEDDVERVRALIRGLIAKR